MNSNLAEVGKPTRWPPGKSGNPAGKPPGTRTAFSQGFIRDFALVWAEEGLEAVRKVAKKSPEAFVAIAARICPRSCPREWCNNGKAIVISGGAGSIKLPLRAA